MSARRLLVTGAASGIGLGIAADFAARGWTVIATDLDEARLDAALAPLRAAGHAVTGAALDVTRQDSIEALADQLGDVDVLVNNAGVQVVARLEDFPPDAWRRLVDVMLVGPAMLARAVLPGMRARDFGRIINIGSIHSLVASPFKSAYVAAKHGLVGLTRTLALETADREITVNAICPGYVWTPLVEKQIPDTMAARNLTREQVINDVLLHAQPTKQFVTVEEVADLAVFLASDSARSITGAIIPIDGGWTAQ